MAFIYSDVAVNQQDGNNFPPGGPILNTGLGTFNDPVLEGSTINQITATYTLTGSENQNDIIYVARVPAGTLVDVASNIAGNAVATTLGITVGDNDTAGGTTAYDLSRYSTSIDPKNTTTTPVYFSNGTVLTAPAETVDEGVWILAKMTTLSVPVAGKKLVFRVKVTNNR